MQEELRQALPPGNVLSVAAYPPRLGWAREVLTWVPEREVLIGLPAYEDLAIYHWPPVENLENGLRGVHAGLGRVDGLPASYRETAMYGQWTLAEREWTLREEGFSR